MVNVMKEFFEHPKKYLTLLGGLICYITVGSQSLISTTSPYYMSYLRMKTGSELARYSNTIYLSNLLRLTQALSAIISGSLMSKFKFSLKQMSFVGGIILRFQGFFSKKDRLIKK